MNDSFEEYSELTTQVLLICPKCGSENTDFSNYLFHSSCHACGFMDWEDAQLFKHKRISIVESSNYE